jgi:hypothetical protein
MDRDNENVIVQQHPRRLRVSAGENTLSLALSYSEAMIFLCNGIVEDEFGRHFHNTRVILQLAHHATELFLKGAIMCKGEPPAKTHSIEQLRQQYLTLLPDKQFHFEIPFEILETRTGELFPELALAEMPLSERFRYAARRDGTALHEFEPFDANEWLSRLHGLNDRFVSIYLELRSIFKQPRDA